MSTYTMELTIDGKTMPIPLSGVPLSITLRLYSTTEPVRALVAEKVVL